MPDFTCLLDPIGCIGDTYTSLIAVVPWTWVFWSFLLGSVFGAVFGWLGVASAIIAFISGFFAGSGSTKPPPTPTATDPKPANKPKKRRTLF